MTANLRAVNGAGPAEWAQRFLLTEKKHPVSCEANIRLLYEHDPAWAGVLARSEFLGEVVFLRQPPAPFSTRKREEPWTARDDAAMQEYCGAAYGMSPPALAKVRAAIEAATLPGYHPVRAYLDGLAWDGVSRIASWLEAYCGAVNQPTAPMVGRWWLISAVARAYKPGCKVDTVIVFESPEQGFRKSTMVTALLPNQAWFCDGLSDPGSKDAAQELHGRWLIELGELASVKRADVERIKAFITRQVDKYRPPYGRDVMSFPRSCVFAGTTNQLEYLNDQGGNRRFWPVRVTRIDTDGLASIRDQLWAEAVSCYKAGMPWWPTAEEEAGDLAAATEKRRVRDVWEDTISSYCALHECVTIAEILEGPLGVEVKDHDKMRQMRVYGVLQVLGYKYKLRRLIHGRRSVYWSRVQCPATPDGAEQELL